MKRHQGERYAEGFTCWNQFVAMLFAQLAQVESLREVCGGLRCIFRPTPSARFSLPEDFRRSSTAFREKERKRADFRLLSRRAIEQSSPMRGGGRNAQNGRYAGQHGVHGEYYERGTDAERDRPLRRRWWRKRGRST